IQILVLFQKLADGWHGGRALLGKRLQSLLPLFSLFLSNRAVTEIEIGETRDQLPGVWGRFSACHRRLDARRRRASTGLDYGRELGIAEKLRRRDFSRLGILVFRRQLCGRLGRGVRSGR